MSLYMISKRKYERLIALRIDDEDHRRLESLADRERTSVSAVVRRFVAEGLDRESELTACILATPTRK